MLSPRSELNSLASAPKGENFTRMQYFLWCLSLFIFFATLLSLTRGSSSCQKGTPPSPKHYHTGGERGASRCAFWFYDFIIHLWTGRDAELDRPGPESERAILILLFFITPSLYLIAHFLRDVVVVVVGNPFGFRNIKVFQGSGRGVPG